MRNFFRLLFLYEDTHMEKFSNLHQFVFKTAKNGGFCEELLRENDFEAVLASFCCYDYGDNASEAVQKSTTDRNDYHNCSSHAIVC